MQLTSLYSSFQDTDVLPEERNKRIEAELAKYLAFALPLPAMPVVSNGKYYIETCGAMVRQVVSAFNEQYPIMVTEVMDLTKELWRQRYCLVHKPHQVSAIELINGLLATDAQRQYGITPRYTSLVGNSVPTDVGGTLQSFVEQHIPTMDEPSLESIDRLKPRIEKAAQ